MGGGIRLNADGKGRQLQHFRIEVVEQAQMQLPGLGGADEQVRPGHEVTLDFNLRIVEGTVDDLRLKDDARAALPPIVETHTVSYPDRPVRVGLS